MKKLILIILCFTFSTFAQNGWDSIFEGEFGGFYFSDSLNGIRYFNGSLQKTNNGGFNWESYYSTNMNIYDIKFFDKNFGIAIGDSGKILKTTDKGDTWRVISSNSPGQLSSVCKINGILYMSDLAGNVLKSGDLGETWESKQTPAWNLTDLEFFTNEIGWGVGYYDMTVKTTDGGNTWNLNAPVIDGRSMFDIEFIDSSTGYVIGGSQIARTTNKGNTWEIVLDLQGPQLNSVATFRENYAWVVGSNEIYHTSNKGDTWIKQTFSPSSYLRKVKCVDSLHAWIQGSPFFYRTVNGGGIGSPTLVHGEEKFKPNDYFLVQNYPNPFNPTTTIKYNVAKYSHVNLKVYDALGREVKILVDKEQTPGQYEARFDGSSLSSGIYFYRLDTGNYSSTRKMILMK